MHSTKGVHHDLTDLPQFNKVCWIPVCSAFALYCFKRQIINVSVPWLRLIAKDQENMETVGARAERAGFALYKFIWYTSTSILGYFIMKDSPVLPGFMGGNGSFDGIFAGMPY